jgi:D-alanine-D-alanine ligase
MYKKINIEKSIVHPTIQPAASRRAEHIVVLMGGMSAEREVSLSSAVGIIQHLSLLGYTVTAVNMGRDIAEILTKLKPDIVFNALHGSYGEDGCIPGMLEILGIPYTHSGVLASSIGFDKAHSKDIFTSHNIRCPESTLLRKSDLITCDPMPRPYVIKPLNEGSSVGVHLIFPEDDFDIKKYNFDYGDTVMVEKYIAGQELQVAVLGNEAYGTIEIIPKGRFYDYHAKYTENMAIHKFPAQIDPSIHQQALHTALKVHNLIGCKGVSRVEFLYDKNKGEEGLYLLEINTHPGMTPLSIVPEILAYYGISFSQMIEFLVLNAGLEHEKT